MSELDVLQIAPNDHPPFADLLDTYRLALTSIGATVATRVLGAPTGEPVPGCDYLGLTDLSKVRVAAKALKQSVSSRPRLALCHRYRSYRVLRSSRLAVPRTVTIAHEFGFFKRRQRRLERHLFARHVRFAGVSPAVQAELAQTVPDPICLPNAMDLEAVRQRMLDRPAALARLGVADSDALTVGLVGRLVDKKSPRLAVEAFRRLQTQQENVRLLVIGDGVLRAELETLAAGLPVTFCGFVPEARRLMAALDLLLLTSKDVEAFGMVALEAMCAGVPVVAGPTPGPQFVLGSTGFYYNQREPEAVAEAIVAVRQAKEAGMLLERLDRARERLEREFSVPALARHLQALLPAA